MPNSAWCAPDDHTFCPFTIQSSPSRTAVVRSDARSEPASGSLKSWHQISSPRRSGRSHRVFCSSVPYAISVGPASMMPMRNW